MDLVAVPDFYIGAMENWGLLTFRETALMYHPVASTISRYTIHGIQGFVCWLNVS